MHRIETIACIRRSSIGSSAGRYRNDIVEIDARRIEWNLVVIRLGIEEGGVASGRNEENSLVPGRGKGFAQAFTGKAATPASIDDVRALADGVVYAFDGVGVRPAPHRIEEL